MTLLQRIRTGQASEIETQAAQDYASAARWWWVLIIAMAGAIFYDVTTGRWKRKRK